MRNRLFAAAVAALLLLGFVVAPAQADLSDRFLDALGDAELGYQKDASDYLRMAKKEKDRCEFYSNSYDEKWRAYILDAKERKLIEAPDDHWNALLNLPAEKRAAQMEGYDSSLKGFFIAHPTAHGDWRKMVYSCNLAETYYNKAFDLTKPDNYNQQARIFEESAGIYDVLGEPEGAAQVRTAAATARARAEAKDVGFNSDCLIVTATFGSPMAGEVQLVRDFRDDTIRQDYLGSRYVTALNAMYYSFSPAVARAIDENPSAKPVMRIVLAPLIGIVLLSQGVYSLLSFSPGVATVVFIILGGALVGLVYLMPLLLPILWVAGNKRWKVPILSSLKPLATLWAGLLAALVFSAFLKIDLIAVLSSGLLFVCTVLLIASAAALFLSKYLGMIPAGREG